MCVLFSIQNCCNWNRKYIQKKIFAIGKILPIGLILWSIYHRHMNNFTTKLKGKRMYVQTCAYMMKNQDWEKWNQPFPLQDEGIIISFCASIQLFPRYVIKWRFMTHHVKTSEDIAFRSRLYQAWEWCSVFSFLFFFFLLTTNFL